MAAALRHVAPLTPSPTRRWWRYAGLRALTCPHGHHIPMTARINETGFLRCGKWTDRAARGGHECGAWVFVLAIRGGGCIIAEVSLDEQDEMAQLQTPDAMLRYLGIFPD